LSSTSPRIERGAALLDELRPGWDKTIDVDRLDLGNCERCILGQLYGGYDQALQMLDGEVAKRPATFGFNTYGPERFWTLTERWRTYIERRRKGRAAA